MSDSVDSESIVSKTNFSKLKNGNVKRKNRRVLGLFIDGVGLDRATRRIGRDVDIKALVKGVTSGIKPVVARYYTIIPHEDDARQIAYLQAISKAGLTVVVKRLPPIGMNRLTTFDGEMSADIVAFALGHQNFSALGTLKENGEINKEEILPETPLENSDDKKLERVVTVVCPNKEMKYPLTMVKEFNTTTVNADFGRYNKKDVLNSAEKWIDLSDSETIWRV